MRAEYDLPIRAVSGMKPRSRGYVSRPRRRTQKPGHAHAGSPRLSAEQPRG